MKIRPVIFWCHLACGLSVGLVVLMMSVTGLLLTYERQMLAWVDRTAISPVDRAAGAWSLDRAIATAQAVLPGPDPLSLTVSQYEDAAVLARRGREHKAYIDPYSGRSLGEGSTAMPAFMELMMRWHRWFDVSEENRTAARAITGGSNLAFGFLVLSGLYLWLPKLFSRRQFRVRLGFVKPWTNRRAADYNRHHVYGFWLSLPLLLVIASATVFSYGWANDLVFRAFGEAPPPRRGPPSPGAKPSLPAKAPGPVDALFMRAALEVEGWNTLTFTVPSSGDPTLSFAVDRGTGGQPQHQSTLVLDTATGAVVSHQEFADLSPGRKTRGLLRRLHTGEVLGVAGQTLAGFACFAAIMLVWTGLRMACRRLLLPLFRRRYPKMEVSDTP